jgi:hypothetical protein
MTCIIGLVDKGDVYMGGDSAGVDGLYLTIRADEKVFINGPFIMGFTTSFRMGQLLRYKFNPTAQTIQQDDMQYMVTTFIDAVRKCFTDNDFGETKKGGQFLVGYKGKLYTIDVDFQVGIPAKLYDAVGCGSDLALGAMYATPELDPLKRITTALKAASTFSAGVAAPFRTLKLPKIPAKK